MCVFVCIIFQSQSFFNLLAANRKNLLFTSTHINNSDLSMCINTQAWKLRAGKFLLKGGGVGVFRWKSVTWSPLSHRQAHRGCVWGSMSENAPSFPPRESRGPTAMGAARPRGRGWSRSPSATVAVVGKLRGEKGYCLFPSAQPGWLTRCN